MAILFSTSDIKFEKLFNSFIERLEANNIRYSILRGYENLTKNYLNDIDFGIHPDDTKAFCKTFLIYCNNFQLEYIIRSSRFGVIKLTIKCDDINIDRVHPKLSFFIFVLMKLLKFPSLRDTKQSLHNQVDELAGDCFVPRNDELNSATIWDAPILIWIFGLILIMLV